MQSQEARGSHAGDANEELMNWGCRNREAKCPGRVRSNVATPCSYLNGCHPRPVNVYKVPHFSTSRGQHFRCATKCGYGMREWRKPYLLRLFRQAMSRWGVAAEDA